MPFHDGFVPIIRRPNHALKGALLQVIQLWRARSTRAAIAGHIDHVDDRCIRGWAWDALSPQERPKLDVFYRGIFLGCARTGAFRQDLSDLGIGDGRYGFTFHMPSWIEESVVPDDVEIFATFPTPIRLGGAAAVARSHGLTPVRDRLQPPLTMKQVFLPLVRHLTQSAPQEPMTVPANVRRHIDMLCGRGADGAASAFADHIAQKYERSAPSADLESFWAWYLGIYCVEKGPLRAPLAEGDIVDRRAHLARMPRSQLYDWAVDETRRLFVEDCLVDAAQSENLRRVPVFAKATAFPLSRFMRLFTSRHHVLRNCPVRSEEDRISIYASFMLYALADAHYLIYIPTDGLSRMLEDTSAGNRFELAQKTWFGTNQPVVSRALFIRQVGSLGFDIAAQRFASLSYRGHRIRGGSRSVGGSPVDVQLIGPFKRKLGLAESCRRIAVALKGCSRSVNFVDYDIGRSALGVSSDVTVRQVHAARINILHLNAEEVPEALAYLPDTFSQSQTILIPYWELNRPSAAHRLGLALVDEVWATTHFLEEVFRDAAPVTHIGMSVDDRFEASKGAGRVLLSRLGIPSNRFTVLTVSDALSWTRRKNVLSAVAAFQAAFPNDPDVALVVKTRNVSGATSLTQKVDWSAIQARCESDPRIKIIDSDISALDQKALLAGADCLLSLHRAEGLGLDILDALHRGTPVVATAYSGNMDVCNEETSWLVAYDLTPLDAADYVFVEPGHVWAEPRLASAVAALRDLRRDEARRTTRVKAAQAHVRSIASHQRLTARLAGLLDARLQNKC